MPVSTNGALAKLGLHDSYLLYPDTTAVTPLTDYLRNQLLVILTY